MPDPTPAPSKHAETRAARYAEDTLGVHRVYAEADEAITLLGDAQELHVGHAQAKRMLDELLTDREYALVTDQRGVLPDLSQAAFERHMKQILNVDPEMRAVRAKRETCILNLDETGFLIDRLKMTIRVRSARLEELGGLLHYYGAVKQGTTSKSPSGTSDTE